MINSKHLRIGNLVEDEILGIVPVVAVSNNAVFVSTTNMKVDRSLETLDRQLSLLDIKPIPITSEILEKVGMKIRFPGRIDCNIWDWDNNPSWDKTFTLAKTKEGWRYLPAPGAIPIKFIHQLQNLYFSLTGEELEIKMPIV